MRRLWIAAGAMALLAACGDSGRGGASASARDTTIDSMAPACGGTRGTLAAPETGTMGTGTAAGEAGTGTAGTGTSGSAAGTSGSHAPAGDTATVRAPVR